MYYKIALSVGQTIAVLRLAKTILTAYEKNRFGSNNLRTKCNA